MLSEDWLTQIANNPDRHSADAVAMAKEILQLRRMMGAPWAVVPQMGELYVEDGNAAMIWPASLAEYGDVFLYRLKTFSKVTQDDLPAEGQMAPERKMPTQD